MSFRIEQKLYIKSEHLIDFKEFLIKHSAKQIYHPRIIKSLYFDNINSEMYNDSIEGLVPRKKIRIRKYPNENDKSFYLEIKNSSVEGRFKTRNIINNEKAEYYKNFGFFDSQYGPCFPNLYVTYKREYFIIDDVRISIDTNLIYENYKTNSTYNDHRLIVEIKTSIKKNLDDLIMLFPFQKIRFSKYCNGFEKI
jgi:SPX domain protein involved in polyphosphate accumulation